MSSSPKPNKKNELDMGELFRQRRAKASSKVNAAFEQNHSPPHRSRGGGGHRNNGRAQQILSYPLEQGSVRNLKDNFGFIQCVEREEELFFHYSEVIEGAAGLSPDQEVEFRVGPDPRSGRVAAFQIKTLAPGTIEWETVEYDGVRQTGLVERRPKNLNHRGRTTSDGTSGGEGTIRLLKQKDKDEAEGQDDSNVVTKDGPLIRFTSKDYDGGGTPNSNDVRQRNELGRGDLVEYLVVKEKKTGFCYAREITRLLTERERTRQEKERKMMASATLEKGVVVALKDGFGFLRSSSRREEIFFHYDSIDLNEPDPENSKEEENFVLKEGQEMEFLVVDEAAAKVEPKPQMPRPRPVQRRISARRVKLQPRGSVKFNEVVARGITGVLAEPPQCIDSSHALETHGKIYLHHPVEVKKFSTGDPVDGTRTVTEVFLSPQDSPGGRFSFHNGSSVGLYVEPGDTLLFDLAIDYCDGACRAVPTTYLTPKNEPSGEEAKQAVDDSAVRLINVSLAGRAEGFVGAVKDTYGFIQYVERPVDVHFKMFQLLPDHLQETLRLNMGIPNHDDDGKPLRLEVGANVQFDLSLRGTIGVTKPRGKQRAAQERENLKAQRVLLLPKDSVNRFLCVASSVKGCVCKQELMQPFVGNVELDVPIPQLQPRLRHPFVWNLLSDIVAEQSSRAVMYHDTQSHHEETTVRKLSELIGGLEVTVEEQPPARFIKISLKAEQEESAEAKTEEPAVETDTKSDDDGGEDTATKFKPEPKAPKVLKTVRFDKKSFSDELLNDFPLSKGDTILCDIVQCRRTGQSHAENVAVVERNTADPESLGVTATGLVKDIGFSRMFAFFAVADESCEYNQQTIYCRAPTQEDGTVSKFDWRKGDNVQFELYKEASGRVVASNVTKLARGSVAKTNSRAECRGILLLQPTQTSLKNTPARRGKLGSNNPQLNETNSRWGNVNLNDESKDDEPILELGVILITDDPDGLFANERSLDAGAGPAKDSLRAKKLAGSTGDGKLFVRFKSSAIGGNPYSQGGGKSVPRRGDVVSFSRGVSGKGPIDVKVAQREMVKPTRGVLMNAADGKATLQVEDTGDMIEVGLEDVVSCDAAALKENDKVEWLSHEGGIYGIARMSDLYLESKQGVGHKERPRLNLAVKKDRGGKIMAQTKQAKGPDGGDGFASGWTERTSQFNTKETMETDLSPDADDFVPPSAVE